MTEALAAKETSASMRHRIHTSDDNATITTATAADTYKDNKHDTLHDAADCLAIPCVAQVDSNRCFPKWCRSLNTHSGQSACDRSAVPQPTKTRMMESRGSHQRKPPVEKPGDGVPAGHRYRAT